jgi:hypothetical protein
MTSFEEYCPLCEGGLLASGGPLAGGGYACARADSAPQGTRARTRRVVRIIVCIACSIRGTVCSTVTDEIVRIQYLLPHELAVEFRRATGSGLDSVQKSPQVHFSHPPPTVRIVLQVA